MNVSHECEPFLISINWSERVSRRFAWRLWVYKDRTCSLVWGRLPSDWVGYRMRTKWLLDPTLFFQALNLRKLPVPPATAPRPGRDQEWADDVACGEGEDLTSCAHCSKNLIFTSKVMSFREWMNYAKTPCLLHSAELAQTRVIINESLTRVPSGNLTPRQAGVLSLSQVFPAALC